MTPAMLDALTDLHSRGGSGVLDRHSKVLASGERLRHAPETWLRLLMEGYVSSAPGTGRLTVTRQGEDAVARASTSRRHTTRPETVGRGTWVEPKPGAE